ncbi:outer membrane beta-barrel protein [Bermanella sp. R86510]|uniref:outer membrane beta-barrel protein n=1 Tax=unclassified Bermanella TaxID=2627862 RepID=UPI0037C52448
MKFALPGAVFLLLPSLSFAVNNYIEVGMGVNKYWSQDKAENATIKELSAAPSTRVFVAGRLNDSRTLWYELGIDYMTTSDYQNFELSSRSVSTGFKFTTNPLQPASIFARVGLGLSQQELENTSTGGTQSEDVNHAYLGAGVSFNLENAQAINIEFQHLAEPGADLSANTGFVTWQQLF